MLRRVKEHPLLYFSVGKKVAHGHAGCRVVCECAALESVCKTWNVLVKSPERKAAGLPGLCASHFTRGLLGKGFHPLAPVTNRSALSEQRLTTLKARAAGRLTQEQQFYFTAAMRIRSNALPACTPRAYLVTSRADSLDFLTQFCHALLG